MIRPFRGIQPQIHPTAFIADSAQVIGDVHVGEQASIWFGTVARGDMFYIRIGDRTNVQDNCVLHTRTGERCYEVSTGSGPGSPRAQPAWGGGCDRVDLLPSQTVACVVTRSLPLPVLTSSRAFLLSGLFRGGRWQNVALIVAVLFRARASLAFLSRLRKQVRRAALRAGLSHGLVP